MVLVLSTGNPAYGRGSRASRRFRLVWGTEDVPVWPPLVLTEAQHEAPMAAPPSRSRKVGQEVPGEYLTSSSPARALGLELGLEPAEKTVEAFVSVTFKRRKRRAHPVHVFERRLGMAHHLQLAAHNRFEVGQDELEGDA